MRRLATVCVLIGACAAPVALGGGSGESLVDVGSPTSLFWANEQNDPTVAIDPVHPDVVVAGGRDFIDMEACGAGDPTTCDRTPGVGLGGIYFSFDRGASWTQPTYTGWTGRNCLGPAACTPTFGPIGTVPWFYENGLLSAGHSSVAFGPVPSRDGFSWANGVRLYDADMVQGLDPRALKAAVAAAVSRTDDVSRAAAGDKSAWCIGTSCAPVIVGKQDSAEFADVPRVWADDAASSPFFGNVYVCWDDFNGAGSESVVVARSTDGGDTWAQKQVTPGHNVAPSHWGQAVCNVRTDSNGVVYVTYEQAQSSFVFTPAVETESMVKSFDGGVSWTRPQALFPATDVCWRIDPGDGGCVEDGIAGVYETSVAYPTIDIANGAPSGTDATNELVMTWVDGRDGVNHEHVMVSHSTDGGATWSPAQAIEAAGDRGFYSAAAISPNGRHVYVVYDAFNTPYQAVDNSIPRWLVGVLEHADVTANGSLTNWTEVLRSPQGDARGSSTGAFSGFDQTAFLGFYIAAAAARPYGIGAWVEANAADCPAVDAYRMSLETGGSVPKPAPNTDCPPTFGNVDIHSGTFTP
jgi:hypothetical protein